jgi:hypothetical protein
MRSFFAYRRRDKARHAHDEAQTEAPRREKDRDRERPPRERDRDRGDRHERGERGDRGGRRERSPRFEKRDREDATQPETPAVEKATGAEARQDAGGSGGAKRPSDREIFEAMKAGKPIPLTLDASSGGADTEPDGTPATDRRVRRRRTGAGENVRAAEPGQARLWVNLGKAGNLDADGITKALETAGAPAGKVAHVEVLGAFSFVFVPEGDVAAFEAVSGQKHGERTIKIERAKK